MQSGRYFVALSLNEAESLRGILHMAQTGPGLWPAGKTAVALRSVHSTYGPLDTSREYSQIAAAPAEYQCMTAVQCFRFLDCQSHFKELELNLLLRAMQHTPLQVWAIYSCAPRLAAHVVSVLSVHVGMHRAAQSFIDTHGWTDALNAQTVK